MVSHGSTAVESNTEVMAAVDASATCPEFVIADVTRDDAWLSVNAEDAPTLPDWR